MDTRTESYSCSGLQYKIERLKYLIKRIFAEYYNVFVLRIEYLEETFDGIYIFWPLAIELFVKFSESKTCIFKKL